MGPYASVSSLAAPSAVHQACSEQFQQPHRPAPARAYDIERFKVKLGTEVVDCFAFLRAIATA
jgi:hypothetical protein